MDQRILEVLRDDGRISVARLAEAVHTSRASAYVRLNRLRELGALLGFSAVVNPTRIGTGVAALVLISAHKRGQLRWKRWREQLDKIAAVEYAAMVTGETDVVLLLRVRDQEELRRVLLEQVQAMEHVGTTHTLMVLEEIVHRPYVVPDS